MRTAGVGRLHDRHTVAGGTRSLRSPPILPPLEHHPPRRLGGTRASLGVRGPVDSVTDSESASIARGHAKRMLAVGKVAHVDLRCHHDEGHPLARRDHRAGVRRRHIPPLLPRYSAPPADHFAPLRLRPPAPSSLDGDRRAHDVRCFDTPAGAWSPRPGSSTRSRCAVPGAGCPAPRCLRPRREDPERGSGSPR